MVIIDYLPTEYHKIIIHEIFPVIYVRLVIITKSLLIYIPCLKLMPLAFLILIDDFVHSIVKKYR